LYLDRGLWRAACIQAAIAALLRPAMTTSDSIPALRFERVTKRFGSALALSELSLEVAAGQTFGLAGMNGAGKTTLIKCLLDFCDLHAGRIEVFGVPHRVTASRAPLVFLPERFVPPYYLTGRDFLRYMLKLRDVPYAAEAMLACLDLDASALTKPVRAFSKGMTQKLGLAGCFLTRRDLYVLDEPTSGLDPKARALLKVQIGRLRAEGRTIFLTSHSLADVEEICDRMAIIHRGELRFAGTPQELRERYSSATLEQAFLACIDSPGACAAGMSGPI
jgi:ABC-2 type transport system ATP-binding protein